MDQSIPWKTWTLPDPREIFGLQAPLTPASPRPLPAAHQAKEGQVTRPRASSGHWPPQEAPVWSPWLCRLMLMLILMPRRLEISTIFLISFDFKSIYSKVSSKVDRKALRMIRNREAASNSRKKKREYMSTLEKQIADLSKIANTLKEENEKLKAMFFDM